MASPKLFFVAFMALCTAFLPAQDPVLTKFLQDFGKSLEYKDEKGMDKALKVAPERVLKHYQDLKVQMWKGETGMQPMMDAIKASWARSYENARVLEKVTDWVDAQSPTTYESYGTNFNNLIRCYTEVDESLSNSDRGRVDAAYLALLKVAEGFERIGHKIDAAEAWGLASRLMASAPGKGLQDQKDSLFAVDRFLENRLAWEWVGDNYYINNRQYAKAERIRIDEAQGKEDKRRDQGYDPNSKGIDAMVMPGVAAEVHELAYSTQKDRDLEDLDFSVKGGPVPGLWWEGQFVGEGKEAKLAWFLRTSLFLVRLSSSKFGVSPKPEEKSLVVEADAGTKPKVTQFFLDDQRAIPYAMWFWTGGERERLFEAELNLQWSDSVCPIFYRSAASWSTTVQGETLTFYDDNADGLPCGTEPWKGELKVHTLGDPGGTVVPLLDSMRVGKGPRMPHSEFLRLGGKWYHMGAAEDASKIGVRPLNPEWFKTGKILLKWDGPKPTAPEQLVIQGRGNIVTAFFDIAGGNEVEVPVGEYQLCFGRIINGKGSRLQLANIYRGSSDIFSVAEGKTQELKMGAPFQLHFERGGSGAEVTIDGAKVTLRERSGALLSDLHNMVLAPEVMAARAVDGKGARSIAKFIKLTDPEMLNKAFAKYPNMGRNVAALPFPEDSRDGSLELRARLPFADAKVGLLMKKHPLFGRIESEYR